MTTTFEVALRQLVSSGESIVRLTVRDESRGLDVDPIGSDLSIREARQLGNMLHDTCDLTVDETATVRATVEHIQRTRGLSQDELISRALAAQTAMKGADATISQGDALTIAMMIAIGAARQAGISAKEFGAFAEGWMLARRSEDPPMTRPTQSNKSEAAGTCPVCGETAYWPRDLWYGNIYIHEKRCQKEWIRRGANK